MEKRNKVRFVVTCEVEGENGTDAASDLLRQIIGWNSSRTNGFARVAEVKVRAKRADSNRTAG